MSYRDFSGIFWKTVVKLVILLLLLEMASAVDIVPRGLARPYTHGSFQGLLDRFQDLIKEITLQGVDGTQEERRLMITGLNNVVYRI